jgi:hypothetical protein
MQGPETVLHRIAKLSAPHEHDPYGYTYLGTTQSRISMGILLRMQP